MANSYLPVDRDQQFLLPPDMREWLPEDHLVWFVIDAVESCDTSALHAQRNIGGVGRRGHDPDMMLSLLLYAYCTGQRSSRRIEALCEVDVAYRVATGDNHPDHTTISRFRKDHEAAARQVFADVLALAADAGALQLGVVAIDGTKMAADASPKSNRSRESIDRVVAEMFAEAEAIDAEEEERFGGRRGDELPDALRDGRKRKQRIGEMIERHRRAGEAIERREREENPDSPEANLQRAHQRVTGRKSRYDEALRRDEANNAEYLAGRPGRGRRLFGPDGSRTTRYMREQLEVALAKLARWEERVRNQPSQRRASVTDPDSRMLHSAKGWVQGYNAQGVCDESGYALWGDIWDNPSDCGAYEPVVTSCMQLLTELGLDEAVGTMVADAGYSSEDNLTSKGPDRLIATGKSHEMRKAPPLEGVDPAATPLEANAQRLRTEEGRRTYAKRQHTIEPLFGNVKSNRGFRSFVRRGTGAVRAEWLLMLTAHNLTKLHLRRVGG